MGCHRQVGVPFRLDTALRIFDAAHEHRQLGSLGPVLHLHKVGDGNGSENSDDRHNDHQFNQGKHLFCGFHGVR
jgi:hypothetical protein